MEPERDTGMRNVTDHRLCSWLCCESGKAEDAVIWTRSPVRREVGRRRGAAFWFLANGNQSQAGKQDEGISKVEITLGREWRARRAIFIPSSLTLFSQTQHTLAHSIRDYEERPEDWETHDSRRIGHTFDKESLGLRSVSLFRRRIFTCSTHRLKYSGFLMESFSTRELSTSCHQTNGRPGK